MRCLPCRPLLAAMALWTLSIGMGSVVARAQTPVRPDLGSTPTQEDLGNLAWTSGPSGKDLPPGSATAKQGATVYANRCAMCHDHPEGRTPSRDTIAGLAPQDVIFDLTFGVMQPQGLGLSAEEIAQGDLLRTLFSHLIFVLTILARGRYSR